MKSFHRWWMLPQRPSTFDVVLLDTNILSDLVQHLQGVIADRILAVGERVCTSIIVAAELRYGAAKKASHDLRASLRRFLPPSMFWPSSRDAT